MTMTKFNLIKKYLKIPKNVIEIVLDYVNGDQKYWRKKYFLCTSEVLISSLYIHEEWSSNYNRDDPIPFGSIFELIKNNKYTKEQLNIKCILYLKYKDYNKWQYNLSEKEYLSYLYKIIRKFRKIKYTRDETKIFFSCILKYISGTDEIFEDGYSIPRKLIKIYKGKNKIMNFFKKVDRCRHEGSDKNMVKFRNFPKNKFLPKELYLFWEPYGGHRTFF